MIRVIVSGLTDVWSAIRNSCASRMLALLETFDISGLETLFHRLSSICGDSSASWQVKEGAALGIVSIIKSFRLEPIKMFASDQSQPSVPLQVQSPLGSNSLLITFQSSLDEVDMKDYQNGSTVRHEISFSLFFLIHS